MEPGKGIRYSVFRRSATLGAALAATLLTTSATFAASSPVAPCDEVARDLQSLNVTVSDLSVNVDRRAVKPEGNLPASLQDEAPPQDTAAPMLYLTPRVANILETVFDNTTKAPPADSQGDAADAPPENSPSDAQSRLRKSAPVTAIDQESVVPRFQLNMYRNDI